MDPDASLIQPTEVKVEDTSLHTSNQSVKEARNALIYAYRLNHYTLQQIADRFSLTQERIRQICHLADHPVRKTFCVRCKRKTYKQAALCAKCKQKEVKDNELQTIRP